MDASADIARHAALDARLVRAVRGIKLLSLASWPATVQVEFLARWRSGRTALPQVEYPKLDFTEARREMAAIVSEADPAHPLGAYLCDSVASWNRAACLLESLGTAQACAESVALFGRPDEPLPGDGPTTREAARHFIQIAGELDRELLAQEEQVPVSATALALQLQADLDDFFDGRVIAVELDPQLIAKAAAGATRIRLRAGAAFSDYDRRQLFHHEALVHSLTALNGRIQANLPSLALASPRVTATQEGLATFAEQITGSIDIERMKRISLRIEAVAMALEGADFLQVFRYFLGAGQDEAESFSSAQRVFRGVPVGGGSAFTKDTVYLRGLIGVHTFFRRALQRDRLRLCRWLFAGKMTLEDVVRFEPLFADGSLAEPRWLPPWVERASGLAGMLAFSLFANRIRMDRLGDGPG
ncbi:flavohemoglobin expression-modulating QEGLA motif protein [Pseudoxanthomonas jiangsuensis]|uniref:flavohemoglobin expression-modulating QEGLA motif protein n=1 Tax=Pseudoxanthomonas jiangsuensis TaxID=619688 RepID=UPI001391174C|nr:flavohemoglobin expression-modulating QEGLA motif protein [Pseudoxanthomonas jiangsuensis]KAF1699557.1 flavohemoglobin expression-modulating QEGLA motif protein [Pseudoxanthomonas jiangsuensis]